MKHLTFLFLLLGCNGVLADMGFSYFYMRGKVLDIHNQPLRNQVVFFRDAAGYISRVKTDNEGVYRVRLGYIQPCLSGVQGAENRRKSAFTSNFPTIGVYHDKYCDELPQQWSQFYFDKSKNREEEWAIQNVYLKTDCKLIDDRIQGEQEDYEIEKKKLTQLDQFKDSTKYTSPQIYYWNRNHFEPLGLTEKEFFEGLGIEKQGVYVDTLLNDKIVISFLEELSYSDEIRRISYIYIKNNGILIEEKVKYETYKE